MSLRASCGLQIRLEEIDVDAVALWRFGSPQRPRGEPHAVAMLRPPALAGRRRVRKHEHAVIAVDHATPAARVARQPRVADGVHVLREHVITGLEARWHG